MIVGKPVADRIRRDRQSGGGAQEAGGSLPKLAILRGTANGPTMWAYEARVLKNCACWEYWRRSGQSTKTFQRPIYTRCSKNFNEDTDIHGIWSSGRCRIRSTRRRSVDDQAGKGHRLHEPRQRRENFYRRQDGIRRDAEAVIEILKYYQYDPAGKNVAIVNRSMVLGRPLSMMFLAANATVTICHSKTKALAKVTSGADIVVTGAGKAKFFGKNYFTGHSVVIDVGINMAEGNLCGDVDFEEVSESVSAITPVPGGVGTVTSMILLSHVIRAMKLLAR